MYAFTVFAHRSFVVVVVVAVVVILILMYAFIVLALSCCCCWLSSGFWCWWCIAPRACKFLRRIALYKSSYYYNCILSLAFPALDHRTGQVPARARGTKQASLDIVTVGSIRCRFHVSPWKSRRNASFGFVVAVVVGSGGCASFLLSFFLSFLLLFLLLSPSPSPLSLSLTHTHTHTHTEAPPPHTHTYPPPLQTHTHTHRVMHAY